MEKAILRLLVGDLATRLVGFQPFWARIFRLDSQCILHRANDWTACSWEIIVSPPRPDALYPLHVRRDR